MQKDMVGGRWRLLQNTNLSDSSSDPVSSPSPPSPAPGQACPPSPPQCSADPGGRHSGRRTEPASSQEVHCFLQKVGQGPNFTLYMFSLNHVQGQVCVLPPFLLPSPFFPPYLPPSPFSLSLFLHSAANVALAFQPNPRRSWPTDMCQCEQSPANTRRRAHSESASPSLSGVLVLTTADVSSIIVFQLRSEWILS